MKRKKKNTKKKTNRDRDSDSDDSDDDKDDTSISKGDRVEAKLKGWTKYYKGKITRENRDGTYDIVFDDGERKSKVDAKLIQPVAKDKRSLALESRSSEGSDRKKPIGSNLRNRMGKKLKLGQRVKTYYKWRIKVKGWENFKNER